MTLKVLTVVGTRPEAIKLAPVIMELRRRGDAFRSQVCFTGQHRQMLDQAMGIFGIEADFDLNIMTPAQSLATVTARAIEGLDGVLGREKPDFVIVQGDTTTAFCGALAAFYHRVPVGHVEAGLRTYDKWAPYPEEVNRRLIGQVADYHFAPTEEGRDALLREGTPAERVFVTGNTVIDALLWVRQRVQEHPPALPQSLAEKIEGKRLVLITGHRRESFGQGFENIAMAIRDVADAFADVVLVYPVHLNPQVREPVHRILGQHARILLIEPVDYAAFVWLMDRATIVLTDSGGIQEEAPSLGKPVLVMRETTERPEGIRAGNARLVGMSRQRIAGELSSLLTHPEEIQRIGRIQNPYGDGTAARQIVDTIGRIAAPVTQ